MLKRLPAALVGLLMILYIVQFGALSIQRHAAFQTHMRDLGNMDQPIWNTLHGRLLDKTRADGRQAPRLTDHVEPIFIPISLLFLLWDDVRALLLLQTIAIALGALPVFWLARDQIGPPAGAWLGVVFAAAYLLFPALQAANLAEFHALPLAVPLLLFAYYYGRRGAAGPFWLCALLALATKEDVALITFMLGLYLLWKGPRRRMGLALAGLSLAWFCIAVFWIIPAHARGFYAGQQYSTYFSRYGEAGSGPREILLNLLRQPGQVLGLLIEPARLRYLLILLAPVGFLALLDPATTLIALPPLLLNMLSNYPAMYSGQMHYSAPIAPFVVAGAVGGAARLLRRRRRPKLCAGLIAGWLLVFSIGFQVTQGYSILSARYQPPEVTAHHRLLERFIAQIPPHAVVSTTPPLYPHLSHRIRLLCFPLIADAEYILLDVSSTTDMHPNDFYTAYTNLREEGFGVVDAADGYILLQHGVAKTELPAEFYTFVRLGAAGELDLATLPIAQRYNIDFGETLRFLGYTLQDDVSWRMTRVATYWQVLRRPETPLRLYPFVMNAAGDLLQTPEQTPLVGALWYPSESWQAGDILRVETLPQDLGDDFTLGVGALAGPNWSDPAARLPVGQAAGVGSAYRSAYRMDDGTWVRLDTYVRESPWLGGRLRPVRLGDETMKPAHATTIIFDGKIALSGYTLQPASAPAGAPRRLTLIWRAEEAVTHDYTVFVHVLAPDGAGLPQVDGGPNWHGPLPMTAWPAGQSVPDTHTLVIPPDAPAGRYRVTVGLYDWRTMARLPATDAAGRPLGDEVELTTLEVR